MKNYGIFLIIVTVLLLKHKLLTVFLFRSFLKSVYPDETLITMKRMSLLKKLIYGTDKDHDNGHDQGTLVLHYQNHYDMNSVHFFSFFIFFCFVKFPFVTVSSFVRE